MDALIRLRSLRLVLASSVLVAALLPCAGAPAPDAAAHTASHAPTLAAVPEHPCEGHDAAPAPEPTRWLEAACPCGCDTGAPPGTAAGRSGPALFLSLAALPEAAAPPPPAVATPALDDVALRPPDSVPRSA